MKYNGNMHERGRVLYNIGGGFNMYTLASDEKATLVLAYTHNMLVRGEAVTKDNVRVGVWLRTDGAPNYIHLLNAQVLIFWGGPPKLLSYTEFFLPTVDVVGFHVAPPSNEALDYDPNEKNRAMDSISVLLGMFMFKGKIRYSAQTGLGSSLEVARTTWMSLYEVDVSNPAMPQLAMHVPMMLMRPTQVSFGV
jgi:hypothetical protein